MLGQLPAETTVLGIDEHTAVIFELSTGQAQVRGAGTATVIIEGRTTVNPAGESFPIDMLKHARVTS